MPIHISGGVRWFAYPIMFVVLGGLVGGLLVDVAIVLRSFVPDFPGDETGVSPSDYRALIFIPLLGILYGSPAALITGVIAAASVNRIGSHVTYLGICLLVGAVLGAAEFGFFVFPYGGSWLGIPAFAVLGAVAALVCGWVTRPTQPKA